MSSPPLPNQPNEQGAQSLYALSESERENLEVLTRFYEKEDAAASHVQVVIEKISSFFGSPGYLAVATVFIITWIAVNLWGDFHHWKHLDPPPFYYLQGLVSANALLLTVAVLIRQNRMSQLAEHRAHLDLQINLLTEQKVTKLLQAQHRPDDTPAEKADLTKPADPAAILEAIKKQDVERTSM